jgi:hypothetical protein
LKHLRQLWLGHVTQQRVEGHRPFEIAIFVCGFQPGHYPASALGQKDLGDSAEYDIANWRREAARSAVRGFAQE